MWTIFRKEFKEGAVLLIVSLAVMILTPYIGQILAPKLWNRDVTDIFHALMPGLFVPLYLGILAAGMVTGENLALLKGLPIAPWKIAVGKLLYMGLNFTLLGVVSLPAIMEPPPWWQGGDFFGVGAWFIVTLAFMTLTFTLIAVLKKKAYAIFLAFVLIYGLFAKVFLSVAYFRPAFFSDTMMLTLTSLAFLFSLPAGVYFFHRLLKSRPLVAQTVVLCCLYPLVAGLFFLKEPGWNKAMVMCNVGLWIQISDSKFLINDYKGENRHIYDLSTGGLEEFFLLGNNEYARQSDSEKQLLYYYNFKITKTVGDHTYYQWSSRDLKTGKTEKLGFMPSYLVRIKDGLASWQIWNKDYALFGFIDFKSGKQFQYDAKDCLQAIKGTSGFLFEKQLNADKIWYFVDFTSAQPREVMRGDYKGSYWSETDGFYLYRNKILFQWLPRTNAFREVGDYRFQYEFGESELLLIRSNGYETAILLWINGRITDSITVPFEAADSWAWDRASGERYLIMNCVNNAHPIKNGTNQAFGILRLAESGHLKWTPLPADLNSVNMIQGMDKILLSRGRISKTENMNPDAYVWTLPRAYLYDLATGTMRKL